MNSDQVDLELKSGIKRFLEGESVIQSEKMSLEDYHGCCLCHFQFEGCEVMLVRPKSAIPGRLWVWKSEFFYAFPKFDLEMLRQGYYLTYIGLGNTFGAPRALQHFDRYYHFLTKECGFSKYPVLLGLSRGGLYIYNWAVAHPECVSCLYGDNPVCDFKSWPGGRGRGQGNPKDWKEMLEAYGFKDDDEAMAYDKNPVDTAGLLVRAGIPMVHVVGLEDEIVPYEENTSIMEKVIQENGGNLKIFYHHGGHHPHGLDDPEELVQWILKQAGARMKKLSRQEDGEK